jgi:hypothetical protein
MKVILTLDMPDRVIEDAVKRGISPPTKEEIKVMFNELKEGMDAYPGVTVTLNFEPS